MFASELCTKALRTIGVVGQATKATPYDLDTAFETANEMLDGWAAVRLTIFQNLRYSYPLTPGRGGPFTGSGTGPYTIGPGGDFDQVRPLWIPNAELEITNTQPNPYEIPLYVMGEDEWARVSIKSLASSLANSLYYNGRFDTHGVGTGLGEIYLWPVPNGAQSVALVLYSPVPLTEFADLNATDYFFPPGYKEALKWQLALRLCDPFGRPATPTLTDMATKTFAVIQRPNVHMPILQSDIGQGRTTGLYDWRTGSSSRRGIY